MKRNRKVVTASNTGMFWIIEACGMLDMRQVSGPYVTVAAAERAIRKLPKFGRPEPQPWVGSWFLVIPSEDYVEGPCLYEHHARGEIEQAFKDLATQGVTSKTTMHFIARVRHIVGNYVIVCKDGLTPAEKAKQTREFNRRWKEIERAGSMIGEMSC